MTNEYKRLADEANDVAFSMSKNGNIYHNNVDIGAMIKTHADILTTLSQVSADEPYRLELEMVPNIPEFPPFPGPIKVVPAEYADHYRNKAMQLAVESKHLRSEYSKALNAIQENYDYIEQLRQQLAETQKVTQITWAYCEFIGRPPHYPSWKDWMESRNYTHVKVQSVYHQDRNEIDAAIQGGKL